MSSHNNVPTAWYRRILLVAVLVIGTVGGQASVAVPLRAQVPDSVRILLSSSEGRDRSKGVSWLLSFPVSAWDAGHRSLIIENFNQEGQAEISGLPSSWGGESRSRYQIDLTEAAIRLGDPAALPGMVYLGLRVSPRAKRFVVSIGGQALPLLKDAYLRDDELRIPSVQAVGMMLLDNGALSTREVREAQSFLLSVGAYELSYLRNAGQFPEYEGIIAWAADSSDDVGVRERATRALPGFSSRLSQFSAAELWRRELTLLEVACGMDPRAHCESTQDVGRTVQAHLDSRRWGPARNTINAFVQQLTQACVGHALSEGACRALIPGGKRVLAKLP